MMVIIILLGTYLKYIDKDAKVVCKLHECLGGNCIALETLNVKDSAANPILMTRDAKNSGKPDEIRQERGKERKNYCKPGLEQKPTQTCVGSQILQVILYGQLDGHVNCSYSGGYA